MMKRHETTVIWKKTSSQSLIKGALLELIEQIFEHLSDARYLHFITFPICLELGCLSNLEMACWTHLFLARQRGPVLGAGQAKCYRGKVWSKMIKENWRIIRTTDLDSSNMIRLPNSIPKYEMGKKSSDRLWCRHMLFDNLTSFDL